MHTNLIIGFTAFLYYLFSTCKICSDIPTFIPDMGALCFLSVLLDYQLYSFLQRISFWFPLSFFHWFVLYYFIPFVAGSVLTTVSLCNTILKWDLNSFTTAKWCFFCILYFFRDENKLLKRLMSIYCVNSIMLLFIW